MSCKINELGSIREKYLFSTEIELVRKLRSSKKKKGVLIHDGDYV